MKALRYTLKICDSGLDMVHGFYRFITEYYIPELNLFINSDAIFLDNENNEYKERLDTAKNIREINLEQETELKQLSNNIKERKELLDNLNLNFHLVGLEDIHGYECEE